MSLRGMQLALLPEIKPYWLENPGRPQPELPCSGGDEVQSPGPVQMTLELPGVESNICTATQPAQRRHSPKGKAVGWIKERKGNTRRSNPTTSYYYCWETPDGDGYKRHQVYVPVGVVDEVQRLIDGRQPIEEVLRVIEGEKLLKEQENQRFS